MNPGRWTQFLLERLRARLGMIYQRAPYRARVWGYVVAMIVVAGLLAVHVLIVLDLGERSRRTAEREGIGGEVICFVW